MTQIIGLLTKEYVMLASDRLLTWLGDGPLSGKVFQDEECKLVCFCGEAGIGYTGMARLGGKPAHEWIAITLAEANCRRLGDVVDTLLLKAPFAIPPVDRRFRGLTFLIAGWSFFGKPPLLRPYFVQISNNVDEAGTPRQEPADEFVALKYVLGPDKTSQLGLVGQPLAASRAQALERNLRRLIKREISPRETLKLLVDEVQNTSKNASNVGAKVLAMCLPRASVEESKRTGRTMMLASEAAREVSTFSYFDPSRNEFLQRGPTLVCGEMATTDTVTESRPEIELQSSSVRILYVPPR